MGFVGAMAQGSVEKWGETPPFFVFMGWSLDANGPPEAETDFLRLQQAGFGGRNDGWEPESGSLKIQLERRCGH